MQRAFSNPVRISISRSPPWIQRTLSIWDKAKMPSETTLQTLTSAWGNPYSWISSLPRPQRELPEPPRSFSFTTQRTVAEQDQAMPEPQGPSPEGTTRLVPPELSPWHRSQPERISLLPFLHTLVSI